MTMLDNDRKKDKFSEQFGGSVRALSEYLGIGVQIAASFALFVFLGYWADSKFGTSPLFLLAGVLVGMVGMALVLMKTLRQADREHDRLHQHTRNHEKDRRT
ncbi:AtpZ/AtpI family protein [Chlorobaculum sp. MV4-Y]|jgi:F0F1-type ATP synthase assembly protein I|nr:AtpZ/AtpI family protein [Chlorobaculum sp. MV4-Y]UWX57656.1 AtpZ/AtpI family protein [Chlorobaculum sp. MV4-Y]